MKIVGVEKRVRVVSRKVKRRFNFITHNRAVSKINFRHETRVDNCIWTLENQKTKDKNTITKDY